MNSFILNASVAFFINCISISHPIFVEKTTINFPQFPKRILFSLIFPFSFCALHKYPITQTIPLSHTSKTKTPFSHLHSFIYRQVIPSNPQALPHNNLPTIPVSYFPPVAHCNSFTKTASRRRRRRRDAFFHTASPCCNTLDVSRETAGFWSAKHRITIITRLLECAQCTESVHHAQNISCWVWGLRVWGCVALYTGLDSHLILSACVRVIMKEQEVVG